MNSPLRLVYDQSEDTRTNRIAARARLDVLTACEARLSQIDAEDCEAVSALIHGLLQGAVGSAFTCTEISDHAAMVAALHAALDHAANEAREIMGLPPLEGC